MYGIHVAFTHVDTEIVDYFILGKHLSIIFWRPDGLIQASLALIKNKFMKFLTLFLNLYYHACGLEDSNLEIKDKIKNLQDIKLFLLSSCFQLLNACQGRTWRIPLIFLLFSPLRACMRLILRISSTVSCVLVAIVTISSYWLYNTLLLSLFVSKWSF